MGTDKKIALITGGTGGMGTAICKRLSEDGFRVVANYKDFTSESKWKEQAEQWKAEQTKAGVDAHIVQGDISDFASSEIMFKQLYDEFGSVDVLINNAGIARDAPLKKMTPQQWYEVINTNLNSVFICSRLAIEGMIAKKWGRIVSIASVIGHKGAYGLCNYATSKAGMYGFTKSLAVEVVKNGITVNTVSPGYCDTQLLQGIPENILAKILVQIPMDRLGKPSEIAGTVSFLCSDDAAFITGTDISANGGQYM